jgi:hypothetical protein
MPTNPLWDAIAKRVPAEKTTASRLPFFGWRDVPENVPLRIRFLSDARTENLSSGYALFEFDGALVNGLTNSEYLFSVSGARLATAIVQACPGKGDTIELTAKGAGVERTWTATKL